MKDVRVKASAGENFAFTSSFIIPPSSLISEVAMRLTEMVSCAG
jgi:hypothetical protein